MRFFVIAAAVLVTATPAGADQQARPDSLPVYRAATILVLGEPWTGPPVPMASAVIGVEALRAPGVLRIADALRVTTGVHLTRYGGVGSFMPVSIRGSSNEQVVVLLDGRRLNPAQGGGADLAGIDALAVERIEVLRGAASALHGAGALGGVISMTTRPTAPGARATARLEGGSFGTAGGGVRLDRPVASASRLWVRVFGLITDGDYEVRDERRGVRARRANAALDSRGAVAGVEWRPDTRQSLVVDMSVDRTDQGVPGTLEFPTPNATRADRSVAAAIDWQGLRTPGGEGRQRVSVFAHRQERRYRDPDQRIDDRHVNRSAGADWRVALGEGGLGLTTGTALRRDWLDSTSDGNQERNAWALHALARAARPLPGDRSLTAVATLRLDTLSGLSPFVSARLGVTFVESEHRRWRLGLGRAFRPPSFSDLFHGGPGGSRGRPDLRPERALEMDAGVDLHARAGGFFDETRLGAGVFWNSVDDLIQWVPGFDGIWRPHNIGLAIFRGVEMEGNSTLAPWSGPARLVARGHWTLLDAFNRSGDPNVDGRRLVYRPRFRGAVAVDLDTGRLALGIAARFTGRSQITPANTKQVPAYTLVDVRGERRLGRGMAVTAAVLNIADRRAVDVRDFPLPGREFRLGVRFETPARTKTKRRST